MNNKDIKSNFYYLDNDFKKDLLELNSNKLKDVDTLFDFIKEDFRWEIKGLCVLGGKSGVGKTTLSLQMADYFATKQQDVLFFTQDYKPNILIKSLKRLSIEENINLADFPTPYPNRNKNDVDYHDELLNYVFTACENTIGNFYDEDSNLKFNENIIEKYSTTISNNIFISNEDIIDNILYIVLQHIKNTGNAPIVFIDYIQLESGFDMTNNFIKRELANKMQILKQFGSTAKIVEKV